MKMKKKFLRFGLFFATLSPIVAVISCTDDSNDSDRSNFDAQTEMDKIANQYSSSYTAQGIKEHIKDLPKNQYVPWESLGVNIEINSDIDVQASRLFLVADGSKYESGNLAVEVVFKGLTDYAKVIQIKPAEDHTPPKLIDDSRREIFHVSEDGKSGFYNISTEKSFHDAAYFERRLKPSEDKTDEGNWSGEAINVNYLWKDEYGNIIKSPKFKEDMKLYTLEVKTQDGSGNENTFTLTINVFNGVQEFHKMITPNLYSQLTSNKIKAKVNEIWSDTSRPEKNVTFSELGLKEPNFNDDYDHFLTLTSDYRNDTNTFDVSLLVKVKNVDPNLGKLAKEGLSETFTIKAGYDFQKELTKISEYLTSTKNSLSLQEQIGHLKVGDSVTAEELDIKMPNWSIGIEEDLRIAQEYKANGEVLINLYLFREVAYEDSMIKYERTWEPLSFVVKASDYVYDFKPDIALLTNMEHHSTLTFQEMQEKWGDLKVGDEINDINSTLGLQLPILSSNTEIAMKVKGLWDKETRSMLVNITLKNGDFQEETEFLVVGSLVMPEDPTWVEGLHKIGNQDVHFDQTNATVSFNGVDFADQSDITPKTADALEAEIAKLIVKQDQTDEIIFEWVTKRDAYPTEGQNILKIKIKNIYGNLAENYLTFNVNIDTIAPKVAWNPGQKLANKDVIVQENQASVTFNKIDLTEGAAKDLTIFKLESEIKKMLRVDDLEEKDLKIVIAGWPPIFVAESSYHLKVSITDKAGNLTNLDFIINIEL